MLALSTPVFVSQQKKNAERFATKAHFLSYAELYAFSVCTLIILYFLSWFNLKF
jgi:hypothetical protein